MSADGTKVVALCLSVCLCVSLCLSVCAVKPDRIPSDKMGNSISLCNESVADKALRERRLQRERIRLTLVLGWLALLSHQRQKHGECTALRCNYRVFHSDRTSRSASSGGFHSANCFRPHGEPSSDTTYTRSKSEREMGEGERRRETQPDAARRRETQRDAEQPPSLPLGRSQSPARSAPLRWPAWPSSR